MSVGHDFAYRELPDGSLVPAGRLQLVTDDYVPVTTVRRTFTRPPRPTCARCGTTIRSWRIQMSDPAGNPVHRPGRCR